MWCAYLRKTFSVFVLYLYVVLALFLRYVNEFFCLTSHGRFLFVTLKKINVYYNNWFWVVCGKDQHLSAKFCMCVSDWTLYFLGCLLAHHSAGLFRVCPLLCHDAILRFITHFLIYWSFMNPQIKQHFKFNSFQSGFEHYGFFVIIQRAPNNVNCVTAAWIIKIQLQTIIF